LPLILVIENDVERENQRSEKMLGFVLFVEHALPSRLLPCEATGLQTFDILDPGGFALVAIRKRRRRGRHRLQASQ
jgi:hypothetical protein